MFKKSYDLVKLLLCIIYGIYLPAKLLRSIMLLAIPANVLARNPYPHEFTVKVVKVQQMLL